MQEPWLVLLNEMILSLETGNAATKAQESSIVDRGGFNKYTLHTIWNTYSTHTSCSTEKYIPGHQKQQELALSYW